MTEPQQISESAAAGQPEEDRQIIARPARYYRNMRYIIVLALIACAGWFARDGWYTWPRNNAETNAALAVGRKAPHKLRTETDIRWQKRLAFILPAVALATLAWTHYNSRGRYRLSGSTLEVPGHPPVDLAEITGVDKTKWKRKGILLADYRTAAGKSSRLRLDDFVYEQDPTDAIGKRILHAVGEPDDEPAADASDEDRLEGDRADAPANGAGDEAGRREA